MLGLKEEEALAALTSQCEMAFKHAHMRKTFKGVAEVVPKDEEEKM